MKLGIMSTLTTIIKFVDFVNVRSIWTDPDSFRKYGLRNHMWGN